MTQKYEKLKTEIILDMDPTDSPVHGEQGGRHFQAYYDEYCLLPLYVFCGDFLLAARLRPGDVGATAGALGALEKLVTRIRARWPQVKILFRADGGFSEESLLAWCEQHDVQYVIGLQSTGEEDAKQPASLATRSWSER